MMVSQTCYLPLHDENTSKHMVAHMCRTSTPSLPAASLNPVNGSMLPILVANSNAAANGSWSVIGLSGCIAIHSSFSETNKILFFERPHRYGQRIVQNPYLTVGLPCCHALAVASQRILRKIIAQTD